jgi:hypothetical protein
LWAYLVAFPVAALLGLVFRFPIPLAGYYSGVEALIPSLVAVLFYSIFGLLPALLLCGAVAGAFVPPDRAGSKIWPSKFEFACAVAASLVPLGLLSVLDLIIGPW